jgi:lysophospholipase L1-like esterase
LKIARIVKVASVNLLVGVGLLLALEIILRVLYFGNISFQASFGDPIWNQPVPAEVIPDDEQRPRLDESQLASLSTTNRWFDLYKKSNFEIYGDLEPNRDFISLIDPDHPYRVVTDRNGFRRKTNLSEMRSSNALRVLCLGDSFTFGPYLANHETWPTITEALVNNQLGAKDEVEVVNAGIAGYFMRREMNLYLERARHAQPDVVIIQALDNDLSGYGSGRYTRPERVSAIAKLSKSPSFHMKKTIQSFSDRVAIFYLARKLLDRRFEPPDYSTFRQSNAGAEMFIRPTEGREQQFSQLTKSTDAEVLVNTEKLEADFVRLVNAISSDNAMAILMYLPTQRSLAALHNGNDPHDDFFRSIAERNKVRYVSLSQTFSEHQDKRSLYLWPWNGHLSSKGNFIVATEVTKQIASIMPKQ